MDTAVLCTIEGMRYKDKEALEGALVGLEKMKASMIKNHPGIISYTYARPYPNEQNCLKIIELYDKDTTLMSHFQIDTMPVVAEAYPADKIVAQGKVKMYCAKISEGAKQWATSNGVEIIPKPSRGFSLNKDVTLKDEGSDMKAVLVNMIIKPKSADAINENLDLLIKSVSSNVITLAVLPSKKEGEEDSIEVVETCNSNKAMQAHLGSEAGTAALQAIKAASESITCYVYGEPMPDTMALFTKAGIDAQQLPLFMGFALNPRAAITTQQDVTKV